MSSGYYSESQSVPLASESDSNNIYNTDQDYWTNASNKTRHTDSIDDNTSISTMNSNLNSWMNKMAALNLKRKSFKTLNKVKEENERSNKHFRQ